MTGRRRAADGVPFGLRAYEWRCAGRPWPAIASELGYPDVAACQHAADVYRTRHHLPSLKTFGHPKSSQGDTACVVCGDRVPSGRRRRNRCHTCYEYRRYHRWGRDRPPRLWKHPPPAPRHEHPTDVLLDAPTTIDRTVDDRGHRTKFYR